MSNIKYLDTALTAFNDFEKRSINDDGSIMISITTILNALKKFEVGIPEDYFQREGVYYGIESWLCDEQKKGNIAWVASDNTCDMVGNVSVDFGFTQFDSLVSEDSFVLMHIHHGQPFLRESSWHNRYPAMLFKFEKGTSFYTVLDDIAFENDEVASMNVEVDNQHYLVLPRAINESYYVKCIETNEELEPAEDIWFSGSEEDVKNQIKKYRKAQKMLVLK